jgi:transcriptional regulator with XRE-family HTH domain
MTPDERRGRRAIETGPTGKTVGRNIARLRKREGLTTRQLSAELERLGRPIPASGVTRMEQGERQVTADDLVALANALRVNPSALLLPPVADLQEIEVTTFGSVPAMLAWQWADGMWPTPRADRVSETDMYEFKLLARPEGRRMLPIQDPESPNWPANPTPIERLAGNETLAQRKMAQQEELAQLGTRRTAIEISGISEAEKNAEFARIGRLEDDARALIAHYENKMRNVGKEGDEE